MDRDRIESILQAWCEDILPSVHSSWGFNGNKVNVHFKSNDKLNATIECNSNNYQITISEKLIRLLNIFNLNIVKIGWKMVFEGDSMICATEPMMRDLLALVFTMNPPDAPDPIFIKMFTKPGFDEYRQQYEIKAKNRLMKEGVDFLVKINGADNNLKNTVFGLEIIAKMLSDSKTIAQMLECQVKFLILHELAHAHLAHLLLKEHTPGVEIEADRLATDVYLNASQVLRNSGEFVVDTIALVTMLSAFGFVDDLIRIVNRSIKYGIPNDFQESFQPILHSYPNTRQRAAAITPQLYNDGLTQLVAHFNEKAIYEMKLQFRMGIIDYRWFKWYCRVRGLEMQSGWAIRYQKNGEVKSDFADKIIIAREWDSIDLQWGPLVDYIFPDDWHEPIAIPN